MKKEAKDKHFIKKPIYPGGQTALKKFIKDNLKYPEEAFKSKIEGTVKLRYDIDYKGNVPAVKIISGLGYGCDEEAIRLVKSLKYNVPRNRKLRVLFHKNLQIHFRLPKPSKNPQKTQINYQISSSAKKSPDTSNEKKTTQKIEYTIKWS